MESKPKIITASLLAPLAIVLLPALMAITTIIGYRFELFGNDPTDDSPIRAAGIIIFALVPILYPILAALMCAMGYGLKSAGLLSRKNLFILCGAISIPLGIGLGWQSPYDIKDRLIGIFIFLPLITFCFFLGAYCWWYIANSGNIKMNN